MMYELECGHCGYLFTLEDSSLTRSVKCPVCGGVLTVAVAQPKTPESSPPTAPSASTPPAAKPVRGDSAKLDPAARTGKLAEPWSTIRNGLNVARIAADFVLPPYLCLLAFSLVILPLARSDEDVALIRLLWIIAATNLLPAVLHVVGQSTCATVPETHGGRLVHLSLSLLGPGLLILFVFKAPSVGTLALVTCVVMVVASIALWLAFLSRVAERLGDNAFKAEVRWYHSWLARGLLFGLVLFLFTAITKTGKWPEFAWFGLAGMGAIGLLLLWWYSSLLRAAVQAIDRHAPRSSAS